MNDTQQPDKPDLLSFIASLISVPVILFAILGIMFEWIDHGWRGSVDPWTQEASRTNQTGVADTIVEVDPASLARIEDIDPINFDHIMISKEQERSVTVSNVTYVVKYLLHDTSFFTVPSTSPPGQPHYDCTATIYAGTNIVGVIETQWTGKGCREDDPILLLGRALKWTRYPNDSAGKGMHWVSSEVSIWAEPDNKQ